MDGDGPHALPPGDYVTLTVTDTGAGMDADTAARVFEPFFTTKEHGTGLGLATAYGIVKQFGGEIAVESAPGAGSAFTLFLPLVDAEPEREPGRARRVEGLRGATILLVEDEEGVRSFVTEILRRQGLDILVAADADEALVLSRGHSGGIDILVTDIVLPAMNGRDLAQHLAGERPELRVLYISGYAQEAIFDEYVIPATTAFLAKPFSGGALLDALAGLIIDEAAATA
jgi:CheY-like chemotaxis protein